MTERLMPGICPQERVRRIDSAFKELETGSWKWENWHVWIAAKPSAFNMDTPARHSEYIRS
jgi:hypothetical protein